ACFRLIPSLSVPYPYGPSVGFALAEAAVAPLTTSDPARTETMIILFMPIAWRDRVPLLITGWGFRAGTAGDRGRPETSSSARSAWSRNRRGDPVPGNRSS